MEYVIPGVRWLSLRLTGESPLLCRRWRPEPSPASVDYRDSLYLRPDGGWGFPAMAFLIAIVDASGLSLTSARRSALRASISVIGDLARISGEPGPREGRVRVGKQSFHSVIAEFADWSAILDVSFVADRLTEGQVIDLFRVGGQLAGVGEQRPARGGTYGRFKVA